MKINIANKEIVLDKKFFISNIPFVIVWYLMDKIAGLYITTKGDATAKMQAVVFSFGDAFNPVWPCLEIGAILAGIVVVALLKLYLYDKKKNAKKFRNGIEYGSAKWGTKKDIEPFINEKPTDNLLFSQTEGLTLKRAKAPKYERNKNVLVIGGSGSGKTRFFCKPNIMQMHSSFVVTDPKGQILVETGSMLKRNGYKIKVFNSIDFAKSMHFNPFMYISRRTPQKDIASLVNTIVLNTKGEGSQSSDDFWEKAEKLLLNAYISYIYYELPVEDKNFITLLEMIDESETKEDDEAFMNPIDIIFDKLKKKKPRHYAVKQYKKYKLAAGKTAKSVLISVAARLQSFDIEELREITRYDELELDLLGDRKTALFIIISDTDSTFNFLVAIMYSQLFKILCERADNYYRGKLPVHVRILADEFANVGQIPMFEKLIATIRSREISACIILQAKSQLKAIYKDNADTIAGNCDTTIFLGGSEKTTLKEISESLGKETIDLYNDSETKGQSPTSGLNYQKTGRELMSQDELAVMDGSKCIVMIRGVRPFLSDKYDITKHPKYHMLSDYDEKNAFDIEKYVKTWYMEDTKLKLKDDDRLEVTDVGVI